MGIITDIRPQRRKEDRLNIYLDGSYAFSLHVNVADQLRVGQELLPEECEKLRAQDGFYAAYERSLHYLTFRPRSQQEVEDYLRRKGFEQEIIGRAVGELQRVGYIDDLAFARFWVENREGFRPRSVWVLRQELRQKGVSDDIINQTVEDVDEAESAYRAAQSRGQRLARLDYQTFRRRLGGFLQRRGFNYDIVKSTVERIWHEHGGSREEDALEGDMNFDPSSKDTI